MMPVPEGSVTTASYLPAEGGMWPAASVIPISYVPLVHQVCVCVRVCVCVPVHVCASFNPPQGIPSPFISHVQGIGSYVEDLVGI